jgi:hypothetical protein
MNDKCRRSLSQLAHSADPTLLMPLAVWAQYGSSDPHIGPHLLLQDKRFLARLFLMQ